MASFISAAVWTRRVSAPCGSGSEEGPLTRTTDAPRARALSASRKPIFPLERLVRTRTGSSGSAVGPALTRTRSPERSDTVFKRASTRLTISSGSASRPFPIHPQASHPSPGSIISTPRERRVSRFCATAACSSMFVFMAGAIIVGARFARAKVLKKSSAIPRASFATTSAEQGATRKSAHSSVREMCRMPSSRTGPKRSVMTGSSESVSSVSGVTNSRAFLVRIDLHFVAALLEPAHQLRGLVRADAAGYAEDNLNGPNGIDGVHDRNEATIGATRSSRRCGRARSARTIAFRSAAVSSMSSLTRT